MNSHTVYPVSSTSVSLTPKQQEKTVERHYLSLLSLAETFKSSNPPHISAAISCLDAILAVNPHEKRILARTHLHLGNLLTQYTHNQSDVLRHLEQAWELSRNEDRFEDVKFESASLLAEMYQNQYDFKVCRELLHEALKCTPRSSPYWQCRFIFQLSQVHVHERDYVTSGQLLQYGIQISQDMGATYTQILFLLSRCMLLMIDKKMEEVHSCLSSSGQLLESWNGAAERSEALKVFFLVIQVCHFLQVGQVKTVRQCLKQLQQSIQAISNAILSTDNAQNDNNATQSCEELFLWMPKEQLCILVYLVTVMHATQAGQLDRAVKYAEKALQQIDKLVMLDSTSTDSRLLHVFQVNLLENLVLCHSLTGQKVLAIQEICQATAICTKHHTLLSSHRAQIHTMLGLYGMAMNCMDSAEKQFNSALRVVQSTDLWIFINLNLAIVYLRTGKENDFSGLLDRINPDRLQTDSYGLKAAAYYVRGLQSFFQSRYHEAKKYLKETLMLSNSEELNRLSACALVLLGHIFLSVGDNGESNNMVQPAMQLARKISDMHVQLWSAALLKDLYKVSGHDAEAKHMLQFHEQCSQTLLKDHFLSKERPEHSLVEWIDSDSCPVSISSTGAITVNLPQSLETAQLQQPKLPSSVQALNVNISILSEPQSDFAGHAAPQQCTAYPKLYQAIK